VLDGPPKARLRRSFPLFLITLRSGGVFSGEWTFLSPIILYMFPKQTPCRIELAFFGIFGFRNSILRVLDSHWIWEEKNLPDSRPAGQRVHGHDV